MGEPLTAPVAHRCACGAWASCHLGWGDAAEHFCGRCAPDEFWPAKRKAAPAAAAAPQQEQRGPAQGALL